MKRINDIDMAGEVYLREDGFVVKRYITNPSLRNQTDIDAHWNKELIALDRLKGKPHVPQIHSHDIREKFIVMSYCGSRVTRETLPANWKKQCEEIEYMLAAMKMFHNDVFCKNICVRDGILYLVDWGLWDIRMRRHNSMIGAIEKELKP